MDQDYFLKVEKLIKTYYSKDQEPTEVLKGVSLEISEGEFVALMGPSGVGKSTFLHLIGSLDKADSGTIDLRINNNHYDFAKMKDKDFTALRNKHIGFAFQFHHLLPEFSALENVMMPALIAGESYTLVKSRAMDILKLVDVANRADHKPMQLSGGEQQRTALARALINSPAMVLADEPTGNLDSANAGRILDLIADLRSRYNLTFIVATHSSEVASIADRIIKMHDGRIQY